MPSTRRFGYPVEATQSIRDKFFQLSLAPPRGFDNPLSHDLLMGNFFKTGDRLLVRRSHQLSRIRIECSSIDQSNWRHAGSQTPDYLQAAEPRRRFRVLALHDSRTHGLL